MIKHMHTVQEQIRYLFLGMWRRVPCVSPCQLSPTGPPQGLSEQGSVLWHRTVRRSGGSGVVAQRPALARLTSGGFTGAAAAGKARSPPSAAAYGGLTVGRHPKSRESECWKAWALDASRPQGAAVEWDRRPVRSSAWCAISAVDGGCHHRSGPGKPR